ncbi:MAG: PD-(D/E)XK nuclease family protein [Candidatus Aenigmarchaeota archaeon]|nr:PD-(D/E)XK nuclease family protein [Candidatus Aenigmarchaeota archaeon]
MIYSHSRLSSFEQCPLKFKYRYLDKIEPKVQQSVEAFMGSMVHNTLEKLYKDVKFKKENSVEEVIEYYNKLWKEGWSDSIRIVRKEYKEENFRKMGEQYLRDYYKRYYPFTDGKIIGIEKKIMISLDKKGGYQLQGFIDRLMSTGDGEYEIHDYKTNIEVPQVEYLKKDRQLALYAIAIIEKYQDAKNVKLIWHFLSGNKEIVIEKTDEELEKLRKDMIELIDKVESEKEFKQKVSALCNWCEFRDICPEWKHMVKTENLEPNKFLEDSGVELVNKYAKLNDEKKEIVEKIDKELEQIKEAIVKFCEREKVNSLNGSDYIARLWAKYVAKFPGKNDEKRKIINNILKDNNLWDELSELDAFKLSRIYDTLPPEVIKKLDEFKKMEMIERVYLRKKNSWQTP